MALRFASKAQAAASLLTGAVAHGLGATPDEYALVAHGSTQPYLLPASAPDATNIYVTMGVGGTVSIFASVSHSIIK